MQMGAAEEFVSEPLQPIAGTADTSAMSRGEPGLPRRFVWRKQEYAVMQVLRTWKSSGREGFSGEMYLRRHWFEIATDSALRMTIYCERQARSGKNPKSRWYVYTVTTNV
jgi:hypothetical protein